MEKAARIRLFYCKKNMIEVETREESQTTPRVRMSIMQKQLFLEHLLLYLHFHEKGMKQ